MTDPNLPPDPEPAEPTVRELLFARVDEHCRLLTGHRREGSAPDHGMKDESVTRRRGWAAAQASEEGSPPWR